MGKRASTLDPFNNTGLDLELDIGCGILHVCRGMRRDPSGMRSDFSADVGLTSYPLAFIRH